MHIYETLSSKTFWLAFCLAFVSGIILVGTGSVTRAQHNGVVAVSVKFLFNLKQPFLA